MAVALIIITLLIGLFLSPRLTRKTHALLAANDKSAIAAFGFRLFLGAIGFPLLITPIAMELRQYLGFIIMVVPGIIMSYCVYYLILAMICGSRSIRHWDGTIAAIGSASTLVWFLCLFINRFW